MGKRAEGPSVDQMSSELRQGCSEWLEMTPARCRRSPAARYAEGTMKRSGPPTAATVGKPAIDDKQRVERLVLLAERLRNPDGLDRDTLDRIEQLPGDE